MPNKKIYVGSGWSSEYGVNISIKKADIDKLPVNKYGDILLSVGQRKSPDEKSKATHYVTVNDWAYDKAGIKIESAQQEDPF